MMGVIPHLEPDILEYEAKWALASITMNKASGGGRIPAVLFQIIKDDAVKVLYSICHKFGKLSHGHRTGKGQFSFQSLQKAMSKNVQTTATIALISPCQSNAQNSPNEASTICKPITSNCSRWI